MTSFEQLKMWCGLASFDDFNRLSHVDSEFCWCERMLELDENGNQVVIHQEVTWN